MLPAIVLVFVVFAYPIVSGFVLSLHDDSILVTDPEFVGFATYEDLFEREAFWNAAGKSVIFVFGTIVLGTLMAIVFALALYYVPAFNKALRTMSLVPWLISGVAVAWIFRFLFNADVGAIGPAMQFVGLDPVTWLGNPTRAMVVAILGNTWYTVPFGTLLLLAGLQMIDRDLFEAARVDGADSRQLFTNITIPQLKAHLGVVLVVFSFAAWNTFDLILAMTFGGPRGATEVLGVYLYKRAFTALYWSEGAALMIIILLINVVLSVGYLWWLRGQD